MFQQMAATAGGVAIGSAIVRISVFFSFDFLSKKCYENEFNHIFGIIGPHRWTRSHRNVLRWKWLKRGSTRCSCSSAASIPTVRLSTTTTGKWSMLMGNQAIFAMCWKPNRYYAMPRIQWSSPSMQKPEQYVVNPTSLLPQEFQTMSNQRQF